MKRRRPEPTQPGNPWQFTIRQHIHSKANIARFADESGRVSVLRRPHTEPIDVKPDNPLFCAQRVWSQKAEAWVFKSIEDAFQREVDRIMSCGTVNDHDAITAYLSIWQIRAKFALNPPRDIVLHGILDSSLTKEDEEILEHKGALFVRGQVVPGRMVAEVNALMNHGYELARIGDVRWGVLRTDQSLGLFCPDNPAGLLSIPVSRDVLLATGYRDQPLPNIGVSDVNNSAFKRAHSWVFGHPKDVRAFLQTNPNPWAEASQIQ